MALLRSLSSSDQRGVELVWVYDISGGDGEAGDSVTLEAALRHCRRP